MGRDGQPQSLHPYAPGRLFLSVSASISTNTPLLSRLPGLCALTSEEILHLRYATDDGFLGRSPISICREALGLGLAQQRHGASVMKDGMMAAGVITTNEYLDSVKGKQAMDALDRYKGAKNAGKVPILKVGWTTSSLV